MVKAAKLEVNHYQIARLEDQGKEVKKIKTKDGKKVIGFTIETPLKKLRRKSIISEKLYDAGIQFGLDYAEANKSKHARSPWGESSGSQNKSEFIYNPISKKVNDIIALIAAQDEALNNFRQKLRGRKARGKKLLVIARYILIDEASIRRVEILTGITHSKIQERIIEILEIIDGYYYKKPTIESQP